MKIRFLKKLQPLQLIIPVVLIIIATIIIILLGRGYRFDIRKNDLRSTGLMVANSDPNGAQVFVDGVLKTATNTTIGIDPGWYTVKISKEGYIPWEKKLRVQGEVVSNTDAFLFPSNPSLSPLTTTGIINPKLSPDGTKLAYVVPADPTIPPEKSGVWILTMTDSPLGFNRQPYKIAEMNFVPEGDFELLWSPDGTQLLISSPGRIILIDVDRQTTPREVTNLQKLLVEQWNTQKETVLQKQLSLLPQPILHLATSAASLIAFSPDEHKVLYEATASATIPNVIEPPLIGTNPTAEVRTILPNNIYVYDIKEDKNYFVASRKELVPTTKPDVTTPNSQLPILNSQFSIRNSLPLQWFPTSRHLVIAIPGKIDIMEYDRTNWITVYSGPHQEGFVVPWPGSSRLIVLTNFNTKASTLPNL